MSIESRLLELGLQLPPAPPPGGVYQPIVQSGKQLFVSGHGPVRPDGSLITGFTVDTLVVQKLFQDSAYAGLELNAQITANDATEVMIDA